MKTLAVLLVLGVAVFALGWIIVLSLAVPVRAEPAAFDAPAWLVFARARDTMPPAAHATYRYTRDGYRLPDPEATPGVVDMTDPVALCSTKWGQDARAVTDSEKRTVTKLYGVPHKLGPGGYEIDHLCSRENCGRGDVVANLWPQPWQQAKLKDRVENRAHKAICQERAPVLELQRQMIADWTVLYVRWFGPLPGAK